MPMINVSRVLNNPRFLEDFVVYRMTGSWAGGRFTEEEAALNFKGVVTVGTGDDLVQTPEGDRITGVMAFHSLQPMFTTRNDGAASGTSDQIFWQGLRYRVHETKPWNKYGYYKALCTCMGGDK
jgi:hypothetical protein